MADDCHYVGDDNDSTYDDFDACVDGDYIVARRFDRALYMVTFFNGGYISSLHMGKR